MFNFESGPTFNAPEVGLGTGQFFRYKLIDIRYII